MNKKHLTLLTFFTLASLCASIISAIKTHAAISGPVVYFAPHQDDDVISMGASIETEVAAGRTVYIVQVTDGGGSGSFGVINKKLASQKLPALSKEEFIQARYREQKAALSHLGIQPSNIFYENVNDGKLTSSQAKSIIDKYVNKYPTASFKTMSFLDTHNDHALLGWALNDKCTHNVKKITDCRFMQSPIFRTGSGISTAYAGGKMIPKIETPWSYVLRGTSAKLGKALDEYLVWNPAQKRYSVGAISVSAQINYVRSVPESKVHRSDHYWKSNADMTAAEDWYKNYQKPDNMIRTSHKNLSKEDLQNPDGTEYGEVSPTFDGKPAATPSNTSNQNTPAHNSSQNKDTGSTTKK